MNSGATQDVRAIVTVPLLRKLLNGSKPPTGQAGQMLKQMRYWTEKAGSRLDRNGDGLIDDPGAASMDGAWDNIADAFMGPQIGSQLDELDSLFRGSTRLRVVSTTAGTSTSIATSRSCSARASRSRSRRATAARAT